MTFYGLGYLEANGLKQFVAFCSRSFETLPVLPLPSALISLYPSHPWLPSSLLCAASRQLPSLSTFCQH